MLCGMGEAKVHDLYALAKWPKHWGCLMQAYGGSLCFKIEAGALYGVGAHLAVGYCEVGGVVFFF